MSWQGNQETRPSGPRRYEQPARHAPHPPSGQSGTVRAGLVLLILATAVLSACSQESGDPQASTEQRESLCDALVEWRQESLADLGDGDPMDPETYNTATAEFYMSLRRFLPPSIQNDIEVVTNFAGDDLRNAPDGTQDAAVRVGTYLHEQCGELRAT